MPIIIRVRLGLFESKDAMELTVAVSAKVPHDLAQQCLMSMPFESSRAVTFLNQVRKYLEFHSTLDILKGREDSVCYVI
jgi:hypothetical protein